MGCGVLWERRTWSCDDYDPDYDVTSKGIDDWMHGQHAFMVDGQTSDTTKKE
jgi:hypothetical protein